MSMTVRWIVDLDASLEEAQELATRVKDWLLARGIVSSTVCAVRSYRNTDLLLPGPNAQEWGLDLDKRFLSLQYMHGLDIAVGREVYHSGGCGIDRLRCPRCAQDHDPDEIAWSNAVGAWHAGDKSDALLCPACRRESSIVDWRFFESPWGFGNLAFGFWDWPVPERLADEIGALLNHRCRLVYQRI